MQSTYRCVFDSSAIRLSFPQFMTDPRYTKLAKLLVNYSTEIKKGDARCST